MFTTTTQRQPQVRAIVTHTLLDLAFTCFPEYSPEIIKPH